MCTIVYFAFSHSVWSLITEARTHSNGKIDTDIHSLLLIVYVFCIVGEACHCACVLFTYFEPIYVLFRQLYFKMDVFMQKKMNTCTLH